MEDFDLTHEDYTECMRWQIQNQFTIGKYKILSSDSILTAKQNLVLFSWNWKPFIERFLCGKCEITWDGEPRQRQNRDDAVVRG